MLEIDYYDVIIRSSQSGISEIKSNTATLLYKYLNDNSNVTFTVNIIVVDINGQRSNSTVIMETIYMPSTILSK